MIEDQRDLAHLLRTSSVPVSELSVGDVVIDCHGVFIVRYIDTSLDGLAVLDENRNGTVYPKDTASKYYVSILDRDILDKERLKDELCSDSD